MAAMLSAGGYLFGGAIAFICRQTVRCMIVITMETGVRTSFITGVLLSISLEQPEGDIGKMGPTLWSFLSLLPAFMGVIIYKFYKRYNVRKYAPTECTYLDSQDDLSLIEGPEMIDSKETAM